MLFEETFFLKNMTPQMFGLKIIVWKPCIMDLQTPWNELYLVSIKHSE